MGLLPAQRPLGYYYYNHHYYYHYYYYYDCRGDGQYARLFLLLFATVSLLSLKCILAWREELKGYCHSSNSVNSVGHVRYISICFVCPPLYLDLSFRGTSIPQKKFSAMDQKGRGSTLLWH